VDINTILKLSRLGAEKGEVEALERDIARILDFIGVLSSLDTEMVEPLTHILGEKMPMNPDEIHPFGKTEKLREVSPEISDGFHTVPRFL